MAPKPIQILNRGAAAPAAAAPPKVLVRRAATPDAAPAPAAPAVDTITPPAGPLATQVDFLVAVATEADAPRPRRAGAGAALAAAARGAGGAAFAATGAVEALLTTATDAAAPPPSREGALLALNALAREGRIVEPALVPALPRVIGAAGDKNGDVRAAAATLAATICRKTAAPAAAGAALDTVTPLLDPARSWGEKCAALAALRALAKRAPAAATARLPTLVPAISALMCDAKADVATAAAKAGAEALALVGNPDLAPAVPTILHAMAHPAAAPECVTAVAGTTFVQPVEAPTLAVLVPLIIKGLRTKATATVRKTALITANMAKLVYSPRDAEAFFPTLLPRLEKAAAETANPECRSVVEGAVAALRDAAAAAGAAPPDGAWTAGDAVAALSSAADAAGAPLPSAAAAAVEYAGAVAAGLALERTFDRAAWTDGLGPVLAPYVGGADAATFAPATPPSTPPAGAPPPTPPPPATPRTPSKAGTVGALVAAALASARAARGAGAASDDGDAGDSDGDDGRPLLCDCEFSLAYGGKILLSNARMRLRRGARYGLCGGNGVGKSTLMRAIAGGKVDGFPDRADVRTAYVESNIDADADVSVRDYVYHHPELVAEGDARPSPADVDAALATVGFDDAGRGAPVGSLSGGWKMKLALARAMLLKADIMLLDEPTNHLDVTNVAWLENYLTSLPDVTLMIVSHDSGFLDNVCTHILHYASKRLTPYRGNLSAFVARVPSAKSYYSLAAAPAPFKFPQPGILVGVSSRDRAILKLKDVSFTYPGAPRPQLTDVAVTVSLSSRIAVRGANGAGKSTLIKLLTGETAPDGGTYWKHPSLRVAYVAQHAFHHVEKHLDDTPLAYIQWRWGGGEDKEALAKATRQVSAEDAAAMAKPIVVAGEGRIVEGLVGRRKHKNSFEYEIKWKGLADKKNTWMHRDELVALGFAKAVDDVDAEQATREGLMAAGAKDFTANDIIGHLGDFGLDAEFAAHSAIRGLSGGQKVKVVLAAACWNCPHIVVLDEPTNFLDRDSLAALVAGLDAYGGGVVVISHCKEFTDAVCDETWDVANHTVAVTRRPGAVVPEKEKTTVSVFLPRNASGKDLALEGEALDAAILEAARLKEEKKKAAEEKKKAKEEAKKLRAARKF